MFELEEVSFAVLWMEMAVLVWEGMSMASDEGENQGRKVMILESRQSEIQVYCQEEGCTVKRKIRGQGLAQSAI